jgi:hypothetical protein
MPLTQRDIRTLESQVPHAIEHGRDVRDLVTSLCGLDPSQLAETERRADARIVLRVWRDQLLREAAAAEMTGAVLDNLVWSPDSWLLGPFAHDQRPFGRYTPDVPGRDEAEAFIRSPRAMVAATGSFGPLSRATLEWNRSRRASPSRTSIP